MGIPFSERLYTSEDIPSKDRAIYVCKICRTHLTKAINIISKNFNGKTGKAVLVSKVWNFDMGVQEERDLMTGKHTCADIFCGRCHRNIGWTYIKAYRDDQKYKVGKYILERAVIEKVADSPHGAHTTNSTNHSPAQKT